MKIGGHNRSNSSQRVINPKLNRVRPTTSRLLSRVYQSIQVTIMEIILSRTNSSVRAIRILAWIRRSLYNQITRRGSSEGAPAVRVGAPLSAEEISKAESTFIRFEQEICYAVELKAIRKGRQIPKESSLSRISPFLDESGLLRAGGRLDNGPFSFENRHPLILG